jgi:glycosyltransferase involved in cell wall biosynthesis
MTSTRGRIIVVGNPPFRPAGGGVLAGRLLDLLPAAGYTVGVVYPIYRDRPDWRARFRERYPHIEVFWYEMPELTDIFAGIAPGQLALQTRGIAAGLRHFISGRRPDLVNLHKESSIWGVPPLLRAHRLPFLATLHGNLVAMLNGATENARPAKWIEAYRQADLVTCCAEHMAVRLRAAGLTNTVTVRNGVDVACFRPRPRPLALAGALGVAAADIVVLHASDLKSVKRPLDVVRGFAHAARLDRRLRLLFVGASYMRRSRDAVAVEAERLGVADRVRIIGWVEPEAMPDYHALADMTVQASASEGLSLTCLEAMASGRALIASDIPAARELIRDGVEGLLFPLGDTDALGRAIRAAAADPALRERLGRAARDRVTADFLQSEMERGQLAAIDRVIEAARG